MTLSMVHSDLAPRVYGPYSQAIIAEHTIYTAGQLPLDPATMELVPGGITEQADQVLANLRAVLPRGGHRSRSGGEDFGPCSWCSPWPV